DLTVGSDIPVSSNLRLGAALTYSKLDTTINNNRGSSDITAFSPTLYALYSPTPNLQLSLSTSLTHANFDMQRNIQTTSTQLLASSKTSSSQFVLELGSSFSLNNAQISKNLSLTPFAYLRYANAHIKSYSESTATPSAFSLSVAAQNHQSLSSSAGILASYTCNFNQATLIPFASISYDHQYLDQTQTIRTAFKSHPNTPFSSFIDNTDANFMTLSTGMRLNFDSRLTFLTHYQTILLHEDQSSHNLSATLRLNF
ncbi:MAG: autotransporter outer membrane beta-barrel domain-containing protein, partial [Desulfobacterales bacterium]|nr:autotransporter outer membrane beta-barrel domain-containing protein [Desulfobacterales bacterium]